MFSLRSSQIPRLCMIIAAVVVTGCGGGTGGSTTASSPSDSSTPPTTAPSETAATPSSGATVDEAAWLDGVIALGRKMVPKAGEVTSEYLRGEAKKMGSCGAELDQLGPATDRLQSVRLLAEQACNKYEEAAECFTPAGSNINEANKCLDAVNDASQLFSTAEATAAGLMDT